MSGLPGTPESDREPPRFLVDHMLYKLGRYLRCLGLDASWDPQAETRELVRRANAEGRVFLTRNGRLAHQDPQALRGRVLRSDDPVSQLREIVEAEGIDPSARLFTRCIRCNVALVALPADAAGVLSLPERVRNRYRWFTTCLACRTVFWKGSHVSNTCRKLGLPDAAESPGGEPAA